MSVAEHPTQIPTGAGDYQPGLDQGGDCHAQPLKTAAGGDCSSSPVQPSHAQHELSQDVLKIVSGTVRMLTRQDLLAISQLVYGEMYMRLADYTPPAPTDWECQAARRTLIANLDRGQTLAHDSLRKLLAPHMTGEVKDGALHVGSKLHYADAHDVGSTPELRPLPEMIDPLAAELAGVWWQAIRAAVNDGRDWDGELEQQCFDNACRHLQLRPRTDIVVMAQRLLDERKNQAPEEK